MLPKNIRNNFLLRFLGFAALFFVAWKPLSIIYLYFITPITNLFLNFLNTEVKLFIVDGILKFRYISVVPQYLQFNANSIDQIFLNSIVFLSLNLSSYKVAWKKRITLSLKGLCFLAIIHVFVLYMYTYTTIWDYVLMQPESLQNILSQSVEMHFSRKISEVFRDILFHWNSWGWDVIPLFLWLPLGLRQFSHWRSGVLKRNPALGNQPSISQKIIL